MRVRNYGMCKDYTSAKMIYTSLFFIAIKRMQQKPKYSKKGTINCDVSGQTRLHIQKWSSAVIFNLTIHNLLFLSF